MHRYALLVLGLWASLAHAESPDSNTSSTYVEYSSVFENKHRYSDPALEDWKQANQTVKDIGGWQSYMRESMQGSPNTHHHSNHSMHMGGEQ